MSEPAHVVMYADLACPFAYLSAFRLRRVRDEYRGQVVIEHKSLALEYVNREPTPKPLLDVELPILLGIEPEIPYRPWSAPPSEWPVTLWPAFEAVKCAERQGWEVADELDWAIRVAFFGESRCVSLRHVLLKLAEQVGLDMARFVADFDSGVAKLRVIEEAREGWEALKLPGSPTLVLPSGRQFTDLGLPDLDLDRAHNWRPVLRRPVECAGDDCLDRYRRMLTAVTVAGEPRASTVADG